MNAMELLGLRAKEVMTTQLFTVQTDTLLKDVNDIFSRESIHHLPVLNEKQRFVGMISNTDLMLLLDWGTKLNLPASLRKNSFLLTSNFARDIMETNVMKIGPDDTIRKCVQIFSENYFRALPVIDETEKLLGIITTFDLMILAYTEKPLLGTR
jgi:acetoin utilization protein AcuB